MDPYDEDDDDYPNRRRRPRRRRSRSPFDIMPNFFGEEVFEDLMEDLSEMFRSLMGGMSGIQDSWAQDKEGGERKPLVWGFRFKSGTNGIPRFEQFGNVPRKSLSGVRPSDDREPLTDIIEEEEFVRVIAELPGVSRGDIDLSSTENSVVIQAKTEDRAYYKELELPTRVLAETATAKFKNGVLEVQLKRIEPQKDPEGTRIQIDEDD